MSHKNLHIIEITIFNITFNNVFFNVRFIESMPHTGPAPHKPTPVRSAISSPTNKVNK